MPGRFDYKKEALDRTFERVQLKLARGPGLAQTFTVVAG